MQSKLRLHWVMVIITTLFACIISCNYFQFLPTNQTLVSWGYLIFATLGQMGLLISLWGLFCLPLVLIKPDKIRALISAIAFALPLLTLYIDTQVFAQYRFHIQWVLVEMLLSGGMFEATTSNILLIITAIVATTGVLYGLYLLNARQNLLHKSYCRIFGVGLFICLLATHLTHIWASANAIQSITTQNRFLPLFYPATANGLMRKWGMVDETGLAQQKQMQLKDNGTLNYPQHKLTVEKPAHPVNIVFIVIDSWRWDAMTAKYSPNIWKFSQTARRFENHLSTGNATRTGIFGLYYGLPATYWHSFYANRRSPVLMDTLQQEGYQLGIFASAHLLNPEFDQTVFVNVPSLRLRSKSDTVVGRDQEITNLWLDWNANRDHHSPAFSFLFYDSPHAYTFPDNYPVKFEPMDKEMNYMALNNEYDANLLKNRYMTSVHYTDSLIGKVLKAIEQSPDKDNTLVIITGDHGQEMNDNHLNYWGHNSNFTDAQIKVPFIMSGPRITSGIETITTSHEDVAPTLLQNYLGVTNSIDDYSSGSNILSPTYRPYQLLASYSNYALVSDKEILTINAETGSYQYTDKHLGQKSGQPNFALLQQAMGQMRRFLK